MESGIWNAPATEQEEIIVLKAELEQLKGKPTKPTKSANVTTDNKTTATTQGQATPKKRKPKPEWMMTEPTAAEITTGGKKTMNARAGTPETCHWCPNHKAWCVHTPAQCKGVATQHATETIIAPHQQTEESNE